MKKILTALLVLLSVNATVFAANWVKVKEENAGTYYVDTTSYKCGCPSVKVITFRLKQVPTYSDASMIIYKHQIDFNRGVVYSHATRYSQSGAIIKEMNMPDTPMGVVASNKDTGFYAAAKKAYTSCYDYCKK